MSFSKKSQFVFGILVFVVVSVGSISVVLNVIFYVVGFLLVYICMHGFSFNLNSFYYN